MRLIAVIPLALVAANLSASEVYRSVAPDGTVIYSDRPSGPDAEPVFVAVHRPSSAASIGSAAAQPAAASSEEPAANDEAEARRIERELAEQRQRNCELARARAESYNAAHRLYRQLPNGEREYLDDAEIDEARAQAAADVEAWCS
ncbi:MAG TPA: DUF4124 domain-containing protein [Gammaproteobacteria bacterium]